MSGVVLDGNGIRLTIADAEVFSRLKSMPSLPGVRKIIVSGIGDLVVAADLWPSFPHLEEIHFINSLPASAEFSLRFPTLRKVTLPENANEEFWLAALANHPNRHSLHIKIGSRDISYSSLSARLQAASEFAFSVLPVGTGGAMYSYDKEKDEFRFSLTGAQLTSLDKLATLQGITALSLMKTAVRDLNPLRGMTSLRILDLDSTDVTDLTPLINLPLQYMSLPDSLTPQQIVDFLRVNTNVININVAYGSKNYSVSSHSIDRFLDDTKHVTVRVVPKKAPDAGTTSDRKTVEKQADALKKVVRAFSNARGVNVDSELEDRITVVMFPEETPFITLNLSNLPIATLRFLKDYSSIDQIFLSGTEVKEVRDLIGLPNLWYLDLRSSEISIEEILYLYERHPNALHLRVNWGGKIFNQDSIEEEAAARLPNSNRAPVYTPQELSLSQTAIRNNTGRIRDEIGKGQSRDVIRRSNQTHMEEMNAAMQADMPQTDAEEMVAVYQPEYGIGHLFSLQPNFAALANMERLVDTVGLVLHASSISDISPLRNLLHLEHLNLARTAVKDLRPIKALTALKTLNVAMTDVEDLEPLQYMINLRTLNIQSTKVTHLEPLLGLPLKHLLISDNFTQEQLEELVKNHPNPETFTITTPQRGTAKAKDFLTEKPNSAEPKIADAKEEIEFLKTLFSQLADQKKSFDEAKALLAEDGMEQEFDELMKESLGGKIIFAPPVPSSAKSKSPDMNWIVDRNVQTFAHDQTAEIPLAAQEPQPSKSIDGMASHLVDVAVAAKGLSRKNSRSGALVADLLSLSPDQDVHVSDLVYTNQHATFGEAMASSSFDVDSLVVAVARIAQERVKKGELDLLQVSDLLEELARLGLPRHSLDSILDGSIDSVQQVVVIVRGPEDETKAKKVFALVHARKPVLVLRGQTCVDREGRLVLSLVQQQLKNKLGRGLDNSLLIIPESLRIDADLPDDILRALLIATLNDILGARLLPGTLLSNIARVARAIATAA